jgi:uroporphyrinogen-III synthase
MGPLHGIGVLVARPEHQAAHLCTLLEAQGATTFPLAAVRISPTAGFSDLKTRLGPIGGFDVILFTSTNAVAFGMPLLGEQRNLTLAAVGPATARALAQNGLGVAILPARGFDSENLLLHPELRDLGGRRVLIIKGVGGREVLQEELTRRGASVVLAEVYARARADHAPATLAAMEAAFAAGKIQLIAATSAEIATNLLDLATPALRRAFDRAHWLVPSARVAAAARACGVAAPLIQADSAEDHDLLAAIVRWRSSESGA